MKIPDQFLARFPSRLTQTFHVKYDTVIYRVHLWKNHKKKGVLKMHKINHIFKYVYECVWITSPGSDLPAVGFDRMKDALGDDRLEFRERVRGRTGQQASKASGCPLSPLRSPLQILSLSFQILLHILPMPPWVSRRHSAACVKDTLA